MSLLLILESWVLILYLNLESWSWFLTLALIEQLFDSWNLLDSWFLTWVFDIIKIILESIASTTIVGALDFLGQGLSFPFEGPTPHYNKEWATSNGNASSWGFRDETKPWATKLVYSIDLWQDQVPYFIEEASVSDMLFDCNHLF